LLASVVSSLTSATAWAVPGGCVHRSMPGSTAG
jgi:hypothetical protein